MLIFFHILILQEYWVLTESRILLKPVLGGVRIVANIKCDDSVTLLGNNSDYMLKFDAHVLKFAKKPLNSRQFQNVWVEFTKQRKPVNQLFYSLRLLLLPSPCMAVFVNKLKKVQERALRFINNDYTSSLNNLLKSTNTQPLHVRRIKQMAFENFKIINKMSPNYINDLVEIKTSTYNFRAEKQPES